MSLDCGIVVDVTTDLISPNIMAGVSMGTPRHQKVVRMSIACSVHVLVATNWDSHVAVLTAVCNLENQ
jgi:hypothetical protein